MIKIFISFISDITNNDIANSEVLEEFQLSPGAKCMYQLSPHDLAFLWKSKPLQCDEIIFIPKKKLRYIYV